MVKIYDMNSVVVGDDISLDVTVKTNGVAEDVTGSVSYFTIKSDLADNDASALSQTNGEVEGDGSSGLVKFNAPAVDTSNADPAVEYFYDIQITLSSGKTYTLYSGKIKFRAGVTLS